MKWNKKIVTFSAILTVAFTVGFVSYAQRKPDYVRDAVTRLSSYLSNYYGPTACSGSVDKKSLWNIKCDVKDKNMSFSFSVMSSDVSPYPVARSFYLKANDQASEEASRLGLMKYLQIDKFR